MTTSVLALVEEKLSAVRQSGKLPLRIELGREEYRLLQEELSPIPDVSVPVLLGVRVSRIKTDRGIAVVAGDPPVRTVRRARSAALA